MAGRDFIGRACGFVLFGVFLAFHLYYVFGVWSGLDFVSRINSFVITLTIILFLAVYVMRRTAVRYSEGFVEKIFPLFCASLPFIVYHDIQVLRYISTDSSLYPAAHFLFEFYSHELLTWNIFSMTLVIAGNLIAFIGLLYLRRSFSIMVEAREPVYTGIYKHIRHPIYLGEIIAIIGVLIFRFSNINLILVAVFISGQLIRVRLEEKKLSEVFPSYHEYKQKTGAFFPVVRSRRKG